MLSANQISSLSNEELYNLMKENGINIGPVTVTTRSVYEKKLLRHQSETKIPGTNKQTKNSPVVASRKSSSAQSVLDSSVSSPAKIDLIESGLKTSLPKHSTSKKIYPPLEFKLLKSNDSYVHVENKSTDTNRFDDDDIIVYDPINDIGTNKNFQINTPRNETGASSFSQLNRSSFIAKTPDFSTIQHNNYNHSERSLNNYDFNVQNYYPLAGNQFLNEQHVVQRKPLFKFNTDGLFQNKFDNVQTKQTTQIFQPYVNRAFDNDAFIAKSLYNEPAPPQMINNKINSVKKESHIGSFLSGSYRIVFLVVLLVILIYVWFVLNSNTVENPIRD